MSNNFIKSQTICFMVITQKKAPSPLKLAVKKEKLSIKMESRSGHRAYVNVKMYTI